MIRPALSAVALLATAACAAPPPPGADQPARAACFYPSEVTGFMNGGPDRVYVNVARRSSYELTLSPGCSQIDWALQIAIQPRGGGRICTGRDAELVVPNASGRGARTCLVRGVRKLSPAETEAARGRTPRQR